MICDIRIPHRESRSEIAFSYRLFIASLLMISLDAQNPVLLAETTSALVASSLKTSTMQVAVDIRTTLAVERAIQAQLAALREAEDKASDDDKAKTLAFLAVLVPQLGEAEVGPWRGHGT
jgi:hypothetical protein